MDRLSYGERDAGDRGQQYLRDLFLHYVSEVPGVIEGLTEGLAFPLYYGRFHFKESKPVREFLNKWSKEDWHLDADWIRERAFEKLCFWAHDHEEYRIYDLGVGSGSPSSMSPPEGLPTYYVAIMKRLDYLESVRSTVMLKLHQDLLLSRGDSKIFVASIITGAEAYCDAAERQHPDAAIKLELERDLTWAVRFQVEKKEYQEIAEHDLPGRKGAEDLIRKAVLDILNRVGLTRRPVPRGRKKGSKNRYALTDLGRNK